MCSVFEFNKKVEKFKELNVTNEEPSLENAKEKHKKIKFCNSSDEIKV